MSKTYVFDIHSLGDGAAGLSGYTEKVTVVLDSGNPLGERGEFEEHIRSSLADWFDGATIKLVADASPRIVEVMGLVFELFEKHGVGPGKSMPLKTLWMGIVPKNAQGDELQAAVDHGINTGAWALNVGGTALTLTEAGYAQSRS